MLFQFATKQFFRYIYIHEEISLKKQSTANYSGDGPNNVTTFEHNELAYLDLDVIQTYARELNGLNISKNNRARNSQFKIIFIDNFLLNLRIPNAVVSIGDIVSKINGISLENKNTRKLH